MFTYEFVCTYIFSHTAETDFFLLYVFSGGFWFITIKFVPFKLLIHVVQKDQKVMTKFEMNPSIINTKKTILE